MMESALNARSDSLDSHALQLLMVEREKQIETLTKQLVELQRQVDALTGARDEQVRLARERQARIEAFARQHVMLRREIDALSQACDEQTRLANERQWQVAELMEAWDRQGALANQAQRVPISAATVTAHASLQSRKPGQVIALPLAAALANVRESIGEAESAAELKKIEANPYGHNRTMTAALNKSLRDFFASKLNKGNLKSTYIDYLAAKAIAIEKNCVGRLATTVQDAVVRQVVAELVEAPHLGVLEIGALFGINLAILYNQCVTRFESTRVICLDPFDGYYGKAVDPLLNTPINPQTFHRNMRLGNVPADDYTLIQRYSTDAAALEAARQERITLLIIDGDHSYNGVKFDYDNYFPMLEAGGYVIFDDYDAKEWPDVKEFVEHVVKKDPRCQFIGAFSRTAIGRKRTAARVTA